jgi:DNA-binding CsgD family transcriptional regulator
MYINNRIPRPGTSKSTKLTARELEVLSVIAQGNSSSEAADKLYLSKRTVDFHLTNIYAKLDVGNRVQALRIATRQGLIPSEPTFAHSKSSE